MPTSITYPPAPIPSVTGDMVTLNTWLSSPTRVRRLLEDLTAQRFIADRLFTAGPRIPSGAVIYDQVTSSDLYLARDVEVIEPGMQIPVLDDAGPSPKVAAAAAYGGALKITDQQRNRNAVDVFVRGTRKLANTIVRKVDAVAIAALQAAPIGSFVGTDWTAASGATMISNLIDAGDVIDAVEAGYTPDLVLLHPTQFNELLKNKDFRDAMVVHTEASLLRDGVIGSFMGWMFGKSRRITPGEGYLASSGLAGGISDETPQTTEIVPERIERSTYITSFREVAVYVTDPKSIVKITGI